MSTIPSRGVHSTLSPSPPPPPCGTTPIQEAIDALSRSAARPKRLTRAPSNSSVVLIDKHYVFKEAGAYDMTSEMLYRMIAAGCTGLHFTGIQGFDLQMKTFVQPGRITPLEQPSFDQTSGAYLQMFRQGKQHRPAPTLPMLIQMDLIKNAQNLPQAICESYHKVLPEHKGSLFYHLGQLALLDLVLGNNDRLLEIDINSKNECRISTQYNNLDNIMIRLSKGEFLVYPIDNVLAPQLMEEEVRPHYEKLVQDSLARPRSELAALVIASMDYSFKIDVGQGERPEGLSKENLDAFLQDLQASSRDMEAGMDAMYRHLNERLAPHWERMDKSTPEQTDPSVVIVVERRLSSSFSGMSPVRERDQETPMDILGQSFGPNSRVDV